MTDAKKLIISAVTKSFIFVLTIAVMTLLLVFTAMIPKDAIKKNTLKSAEYLAGNELYPLMVEGVDGSRIDVYADSILLNIIYSYDSSKALTSVMRSAYCSEESQDENLNLLEAVSLGKEPNQQYLRYWHGSSVIVRPLLTILPIQKIYILNAVVIALLFIWFLVTAKKTGNGLIAAGMILSLIMTRIWYVPLCLEYTWIFLILPVASVFAIRLAEKKDKDKIIILFMLVGMITNYLDFLTAETLTLLIPLIIVMSILKKHKENAKDIAGISVRAVIAWGLGYTLTWISKWVLSALFLGENVMPYISGHISQRIGQDLGIGFFRYLTGAVFYNFTCLFPLRHSFWSMIGFGLIIMAVIYFGYVYKKPGWDKKIIILYAVTGAVPIVRFLFLHNHSYLHCFFSYRALAASVMAVVMVIGELTMQRSGGQSDE